MNQEPNTRLGVWSFWIALINTAVFFGLTLWGFTNPVPKIPGANLFFIVIHYVFALMYLLSIILAILQLRINKTKLAIAGLCISVGVLLLVGAFIWWIYIEWGGRFP